MKIAQKQKSYSFEGLSSLLLDGKNGVFIERF